MMSSGRPEVLHHGVADAPHRRQRQQALLDAVRDEAQQGGVDPQRKLRRVRRLGEDVEHVADAIRRRIDQVERLLVAVLRMRDVVDRIDDEVDRHDVDATAFDADRRHPRRQEAAHALDQLEEVVRSVDLVHLAGLAVAHDQARAIDAPGHLRFLADDLFRVVLGGEVRVIEVLGLVEHVLAEHALVHAGRGDRGNVLEDAGLDLVGERHRVLRAVDVGDDLALCVRLQVVDGRQVEEMLDLAGQFLLVGLGHSEHRLAQVTDDRHGTFLGGLPVLEQRRHLVEALLAHEEVDRRAAAGEQFLDEALADETGRAGDEVRHRMSPPGRMVCSLYESRGSVAPALHAARAEALCSLLCGVCCGS